MAELARPNPVGWPGQASDSRWLVLLLALTMTECRSLLPRSRDATSAFRHFEKLRATATVESLLPSQSDQRVLIDLDIDVATLPNTSIQTFAWMTAAAMAQNVVLCCAGAGLATVLRAWIGRDDLARARQA